MDVLPDTPRTLATIDLRPSNAVGITFLPMLSQSKNEAMETTLFDRTFRDSSGKIVIAQMPKKAAPGFFGSNFTPIYSDKRQDPYSFRFNRIWFLVHLGVAGTISGR